MSLLPPTLAVEIRTFLSQPQVDLDTVSAKQIRLHLATVFPELDIKTLKQPIDEISIPIFYEIKEAAATAATKAPPRPSPPALALPTRGIPGGGGEPSTSSQVSSSHEEILGYSLPVSRPSQRSSKSNGKAQKRKSAAYVDSEDEDPGDGTPKKKSKSTTKKPRATRTYADGATPTTGIHKEMNCSPALADVIGVPTCSRPQVVKKIWEYIKANSLQDPQDKRQIICDERMRKVFNVNSVHMFTMNKLLGNHLYKNDEVVQS